MKYPAWPITSLLLVAWFAGCNRNVDTSNAAPLSDKDTAAIRAKIDEYVRHALAADWDAWGKTLTDDVISQPPNQPPLVGRKAVVDYIKTYPKLTRFTVDVNEVTGRGDIAYARGLYSISAKLPDGSAVEENGSFLEIHQRQPDGSWPYSRLIWHSDSPASTAVSAK